MEKRTIPEKKTINELDFGSGAEEAESDYDEKFRNATDKKKSKKPVTKKSIFMDEDEESDDDEVVIKKAVSTVKATIHKPIIGDRLLSEYIYANANKYSFKTWQQCFPDKKVSLRSLIFNPAWNEFFDIVEKKPYFNGLERILSSYLTKNEYTILPYAELVFNAFNVLSPNQIKVVILGQDPYPGGEKINGKLIPAAMGFSFSAPLNFPKPKSLENIYNNLKEFGHIKKIPDSGCLAYLIMQGCFMINSAFTTFYGKSNVHKETWKSFTFDLMLYLNTKLNNVVFVAWGADAHRLCLNIDPQKHRITTSSHPSPFSFANTFSGKAYGYVKNPADRKDITYPPFKSTDHFGRINEYLISVNKKEIIWDIIDE